MLNPLVLQVHEKNIQVLQEQVKRLQDEVAMLKLGQFCSEPVKEFSGYSTSTPSASENLKERDVIRLTPAEIQSGLNRVVWAENLIKQLPADHDGRNSWLLNYGSKPKEPLPCEHEWHTITDYVKDYSGKYKYRKCFKCNKQEDIEPPKEQSDEQLNTFEQGYCQGYKDCEEDKKNAMEMFGVSSKELSGYATENPQGCACGEKDCDGEGGMSKSKETSLASDSHNYIKGVEAGKREGYAQAVSELKREVRKKLCG